MHRTRWTMPWVSPNGCARGIATRPAEVATSGTGPSRLARAGVGLDKPLTERDVAHTERCGFFGVPVLASPV